MIESVDAPGVRKRATVAWILVPAVIMSLGWGLRGYIGGGPYGAMIPGALVSLMLCQYLRVDLRTASVVVAFGTIGIGFGGNMTYGQTLGLIRGEETFLWGLTGTTTKGAVWGLLGGAMLGLGFVAGRMHWRHLFGVLGLLLIGITIGITFVNVPKLIYFSDPLNKPRDESWAGLLAGAIALLGYLRIVRPGSLRWPAMFAFYGAISGGLGFGIGSLFIAWQPHISDSWRWLPYWKFMEFTFGLLFGAGLGFAAYRLWDHAVTIETSDDAEATQRSSFSGTVGQLAGGFVVLFVFYLWPRLSVLVFPNLAEVTRSSLSMTAIDVLTDFTGLGCVMLLLSRRWPTVAWHLAVSVTIVAAMIDWLRDLHPRGDINMPEQYRLLVLFATAATSVIFVHRWLQGRRPSLTGLFLFAICVFMGIGYMMGLGRSDIWWPNPESVALAGGRWSFLWQTFPSELIVHAIFTTLFVLSLYACFQEPRATVN